MPAFCLPPVMAVPTTAEMGCLPLVPGRLPWAASAMAAAVEPTRPPLFTAWLTTASLTAPVTVVSRSNLSDMARGGQIDI